MSGRPKSSTTAVAHQIGVSHQTVCRVLNENCLHAFHIQQVQNLNPADYPLSLNFCQWMMRLGCIYVIDHVLFTDEMTFSLEDLFIAHNSHVWATDYPHAMRRHAYQQ